MNKMYAIAISSGMTICTPAFAQQHEAQKARLQPAIEANITSLKALVAAAEREGQKTAFVGGPVWSVDGSEKPKPGYYLLDDGHVLGVRD